MNNLQINNLNYGYGTAPVLANIDKGVSCGEILCILGPDGTGQTSFYKTILELIQLQEGELILDAHNDQTSHELLTSLDILYLKDEPVTRVSGEARQIVMIARMLAQKSKVIIMDEPVSNLDFDHQVKVLSYMNNLALKGINIIMTSHFPNHAFLCSCKVALIFKGELLDFGNANDILTELKLKQIYGIDIRTVDYEYDGKKLRNCIPLI